jgi:CBS domain-containing protein
VAKAKKKHILARDIMTEDVHVVQEKMPIHQVAHLMLRMKVSGYPVVNGKGKVVGIVTLTDLFILINRLSREGKAGRLEDKIKSCRFKTIKEIMSRNVIAISPKTPLHEIIEAVVNWNIHSFPVMDKNKLVGIIGRHDILNAAFVYT